MCYLETVILLAGCKFLSGQIESAKIMLEAKYETLKKEYKNPVYKSLSRRHSADFGAFSDEDVAYQEDKFNNALVRLMMLSTNLHFFKFVNLSRRFAIILGLFIVLITATRMQ